MDLPKTRVTALLGHVGHKNNLIDIIGTLLGHVGHSSLLVNIPITPIVVQARVQVSKAGNLVIRISFSNSQTLKLAIGVALDTKLQKTLINHMIFKTHDIYVLIILF